MCCWAVATAFPGVCLQNNEAGRNWDEFFMILDDRAEDVGGDLFLILPVFTTRTELGILGREERKIRGGKRRNRRREGGNEEREGSAIPSVCEMKKMRFFSPNPHLRTEKSQDFPSESKPDFFMVPDEVFTIKDGKPKIHFWKFLP